MKKIIAMALAAVMALSMVACGGETKTDVTYKVGMGVVTEEAVQDATADKAGKAEIITTVAVVTLDAEGKIVKADIDVADNTTKFDATGVATADSDLRTKMEKGAEYGMKSDWGSKIGEWNEQIEAFENWMVGKTVAEVVEMELGENGAGRTDTPVAEDLKATTTISMSSMLMAVKEAAEKAVEVKNVATVGLGSDIVVTAKNAGDADGQAQVASTWAAVALDAEGKILFAEIDTADQTTKFSTAGVVTANADVRTKADKGAEYGMKSDWGSKIGEWFEQIDAFESWMVGKTVAEVVEMELGENGAGRTDTPVAEDLKATTTISMGTYLIAIAEAAECAK